jgi:superfamily II DNA/RNA helicase
MKFEDLNIEPSILGSLYNMGYKTPTKIQYETIPFIKQGRDVIGQSETGSGKTAAFGVPMVEKVKRGKGIQAMVLAPTRELAIQIAKELRKFSARKELFVQNIYGGVAMGPQVRGLRRADIVVGTPGRVMDHMRRGTLSTDKIRIFVLDEADRMINMGFIEDIEFVARSLPKDRQTLLFSATMPYELLSIRERFTRDAKKIKTANKVREDVLAQYYCDIDRFNKFSLLLHLIREEKPELGIIFCNTRRDVDSVSKNLKHNGIVTEALHGGMTQAKRENVIKAFHNNKFKFLVATDVAGRGLDIKNVSHIFNYSVPNDAEDYANRIGRTARAGDTGKAISLISRDDHQSFMRIIRLYDYDIKKMEITGFDHVPFRRETRRGPRRYGRSRFGGGRRSEGKRKGPRTGSRGRMFRRRR